MAATPERIVTFKDPTFINNSTSDPASISPPAPWLVAGKIQFDSPATLLQAMAYQINDGSLVSFQPPMGLAGADLDYSFLLSETELPSDGFYLLTIYAWDDNQGFNTLMKNIQVLGTVTGGIGGSSDPGVFP